MQSSKNEEPSRDFLLGCHRLTTQTGQTISIDEQFRRVRDACVYDFFDWLPRPEVLDECIRCSEKYDLPMTAGGFQYMLGRDDEMIEQDMRNGARAGLKLHNMMIYTHAADGHELTDDDLVTRYLRCWELGDKLGLEPSFELHVNMWSEKFRRVFDIADRVGQAGIPFNLTLDYSHCVFKIENPAEQDISEAREDIEAGRMILDPFEKGSLCERWLEMNIVAFAQFRPVAPNGPRNVWAKNAAGNPGRGIQYPFVKPASGEWHSPWHAYRLEPSKEALRKVMRYHLTHPESRLRFVNTEMINLIDYGENARYSIFEQNVACARWIRATWTQMKAMHTANIPLEI